MNWKEIFPVVTPRGNDQWLAKCPAHEDRTASLSIRLTGDRVLLKCFAGDGCPPAAICEAAGIKVSDLFFGPKDGDRRKRQASRIVAAYTYRDEGGKELFQVLRMDPKEFRQRHREPGGEWKWDLKNVRRVPYRLPEIRKQPDHPVIVVEGEKDVDRLLSIGLLATCNNGGAGKWDIEFGRHFKGRRVAVIADNDGPGRQHASLVAGSLLWHSAAAVGIVHLDVPEKGDVSDYLNGGGTKASLIRMIRAANWYAGIPSI